MRPNEIRLRTSSPTRHDPSASCVKYFSRSAALVARRRKSALFIDLGSTTTDIVPVAGGEIVARGYTDAERLAAGELVYTGLVRGFVMATAQRAPFGGVWTPLINENFATMADVHRVLGTLPDGVDQMASADGRAKTAEASRARLARMVGRDAADANAASWRALAAWFAEMQLRDIEDGARLVLSRSVLLQDAPPGDGIRGVGQRAWSDDRGWEAIDSETREEAGGRAGMAWRPGVLLA